MLDLKQVDLKQVRDDVADRVGRAAKELTSNAQTTARKQLPKRRGFSFWGMAAGALAGAIVAYLFDPERGKGRRATLAQ